MVLESLGTDISSGHPVYDMPGYTSILDETFPTVGYNNNRALVWTRTAQAGDSASLTVSIPTGPYYKGWFVLSEIAGAGTPAVSYGNLDTNGNTPVINVSSSSVVLVMDDILDSSTTHNISPSFYTQLYSATFTTNSRCFSAGQGNVPSFPFQDAAIGNDTPPINGPYLIVVIPVGT